MFAEAKTTAEASMFPEVFLHLWPVFKSLVTLGTIMHKLNIKDQRYNMNGLMVQVLGLHMTVSVHL